MKYFKKLMLVILLSNMMIVAEDDLNFPNDNGFAKHAASSTFSSQIPMLFVDISFAYGQPIVGIFYFMYAVVAESFYAGVMNFSFRERAASMKRSEGVLRLPDMDSEQEDNVLRIIIPERPFSPCCFIGSPLQSPEARKRFPSNTYMTTSEMF